jgi:tetratricopeptide (TPR) repeat protein
LLAAFCCSLTVFHVVTTYQRNLVWGNKVSLWRDVIAKSPNKARPNNNLGSALIDANRPDEAIPFLEKAISIKPDYADPYYNLGTIFLVNREDYNTAISLFTKAIMLRPGFSDAYINLAGAYNRIGRYDETVRLLSGAKAKIAGRIGAHFNLCVAYTSLGNMEAAGRELEIIRRMDPKSGRQLEDAIRQFRAKGSWKQVR